MAAAQTTEIQQTTAEPALVSRSRSFAVRVLLFVTPIAIVLALPIYVLVLGGEMSPLDLDSVARRHEVTKELVLFGPAYTNINKPYKVRAATGAKARVLVVGSSRSMQFRASFFPRDVSFYNAGGSVSKIGHLRKLLERFPKERQPEIVFVALDQWFFNPKTEASFEAEWDAQVDAKNDVLGVFQSSWANVYADFVAGKFTLAQIASSRHEAIGINAIVLENGFRNDGSYFYGAVTNHPENPNADPDRRFALSLARARAGSTRFEYASQVDAGVVVELGRFLDEAKSRGIHVVGFLTSYAPTVIGEMRAIGKSSYIEQIDPTVRPLFAARGFSFFDFTDLSPLGSSDQEFIDGVHASEYAHLRMVRAMLEADSTLARYTSRAHIDALATSSKGPLALSDDRWR